MVPLTTELLLRHAAAIFGESPGWLRQARTYAAYDNPDGMYNEFLVHLRSRAG
jgi:hypothetical protein